MPILVIEILAKIEKLAHNGVMQTLNETPLDRAIKVADGITSMARSLGLSSHMVIHHWKKNGVPAEHCPNVEALTGVRCEELRPDVNWAVLRGKEAA
jgi:DNA-binding transcriptional regulator YdaS (Cro superfamily)